MHLTACCCRWLGSRDRCLGAAPSCTRCFAGVHQMPNRWSLGCGAPLEQSNWLPRAPSCPGAPLKAWDCSCFCLSASVFVSLAQFLRPLHCFWPYNSPQKPLTRCRTSPVTLEATASCAARLAPRPPSCPSVPQTMRVSSALFIAYAVLCDGFQRAPTRQMSRVQRCAEPRRLKGGWARRWPRRRCQARCSSAGGREVGSSTYAVRYGREWMPRVPPQIQRQPAAQGFRTSAFCQ